LPEDQATNILNIFNSFHDKLQFTIEWKNNRRLSFLDLQLEVVNGSIVLDWFHKETFSGRFLSYFSNHPHDHKVGTMYNLVDRVILLSHPNFQQKNLKLCVKLLLENGYLLNLIFKEINVRLKKLLNIKLSINTNKQIALNNSNDIKDIKKNFL